MSDRSVNAVLVIAPLVEEMRALARSLGVTCPSRGEVIGTEVRGQEVLLAVVGDGASEAAATARRMAASHQPSLVIIAGVAGALSPGLEVGDVTVAERVVSDDGREALPDPHWVDIAASQAGAHRATALCTAEILCTAEAKARAWRDAGSPAPATVDLESAALVDVASERGVASVVLRAISDTAREDLPLDFNSCLAERGSVARGRVIRRALLSPRSIRGLWRLNRRLRSCAGKLAVAVQLLLEQTQGSATR